MREYKIEAKEENIKYTVSLLNKIINGSYKKVHNSYYKMEHPLELTEEQLLSIDDVADSLENSVEDD